MCTSCPAVAVPNPVPGQVLNIYGEGLFIVDNGRGIYVGAASYAHLVRLGYAPDAIMPRIEESLDRSPR